MASHNVGKPAEEYTNGVALSYIMEIMLIVIRVMI